VSRHESPETDVLLLAISVPDALAPAGEP